MNPLTHDEIHRANSWIATLGPDKMAQKQEALDKFRGNNEEWLIFIRSKINPQ